MTFFESIAACFAKYADFSGRASRSEFWWWSLFVILATIAAEIISSKLSGLFSLATLLPSLAVGSRRLHDVNKSGWLQLLYFIPLIGWLLLAYWSAKEAEEPNRF